MAVAQIYEHVHISRGISKLGADIPSINLPVGKTCRPDAPCYKRCYARRGRFAFPRNKSLLNENLELWLAAPQSFERDIMIAAFHSRFFRWHSSGDIPDENYLEMMVRVASALPETRFLCFTKKYGMVNRYPDIHKQFPETLRMVFSEWGDFKPYNPHNLPIAYVRFKKGQTQIPASAFQCQKYCGDCVMTGCSCWDLEHGQSVVFDEH